jgi:hypothetical protein
MLHNEWEFDVDIECYDGMKHSFKLVAEYMAYKGRPATLEDPPEPAELIIEHIRVDKMNPDPLIAVMEQAVATWYNNMDESAYEMLMDDIEEYLK